MRTRSWFAVALCLLFTSSALLSQQPSGFSPIAFEANQGQWPPTVAYAYRDARSSVFLSIDEAVLVMALPAGEPDESTAIVRLRFVGADPSAPVRGLDPLAAVTNYYIGSDPSRWHSGIPSFARVMVTDLYPGIDLIYRGAARRLEYDFLVHPGGDPDRIELAFEGVEAVRLDEHGDLRLTTRAGEIIQPRPTLFQEIGDARIPVAGGYRMESTDQVRFAVGDYDREHTLVIDPQFPFVYFTYLGGGGGISERGTAIAASDQGEAYVTGDTPATDYPTTVGVHDDDGTGCSAAARCVFVTRLAADGGSLLYSTYLGGSAEDAARGIAVGPGGDAFVAGFTYSIDFPTTAQAYQQQPPPSLGGMRGFVTRLGPTGQLVYSTYLAGERNDAVQSIAVDVGGNAFVTGHTASTSFPVTGGVAQPISGGHLDTFVTKLNAAGSSLLYSTYLGGSNYDLARAIAIDWQGNAFVTGSTASQDFPTTSGAFQTSPDGGDDVFVAGLNASGSALLYSTYLGGSGHDFGRGIAVDGLGSAYVTGETLSADFDTTAGAFDDSFEGASDAFVTKLNPTGTSLSYSTLLGGPGIVPTDRREERALGIAVDSAGVAFVGGETASPDFPVTPEGEPCILVNACGNWVCQYTPLGFVSAVHPNGTDLVYSTYLGGNTGIDGVEAIAVDAAGNAYVTGYSSSLGLAMPGAYDDQPDSIDAFAAKIQAFQVRRSPLQFEIHETVELEPWGPAEFSFVVTNESVEAVSKVELRSCFAGGDMAFVDASAEHEIEGCCARLFLVDLAAGAKTKGTIEVVPREVATYRMVAQVTATDTPSHHQISRFVVGEEVVPEAPDRPPLWVFGLLLLVLVLVIWMASRGQFSR